MTPVIETEPILPVHLMESIVNGNHGRPYDVLGPHPVDDGEEAGAVVRVFLPYATQVTLVAAEQEYPCNQIHSGGLFEVFVPLRPPFSYQLRVLTDRGDVITVEDPYRFPLTLSDYDTYLMGEGTHMKIYEQQGAHLRTVDGVSGVRFIVWAPNAMRVSVVGDFNQWDGRRHPMMLHAGTGMWELFIPDLGEGIVYKYEVKSHNQGLTILKTDPVGFYSEIRPNNASIVWDIDKYAWQDAAWMEQRAQTNDPRAPISVYEVHLGSWRRKLVDDKWEWLSYAELADALIPYLQEMGYTHIELLPVSEHPFDGSWGYQVIGYFAPTSRFGTPDDFMAFVDACHQAGIGVILDWVPAHFPRDMHGLAFFDGTHLYEHADPRQGAHPDWGTLIFNYDRNEVRQFLVSNALFWLDKYHIDGLRVDAVASMLYLDFSREPGQWIPNRYGGRENLGAITFLRLFNERVHEQFPHVLTIAEESTAWPGVTAPVEEGGLGFDFKWNMGWMHDTLRYMGNDPVYRSYHQGTLTFSLLYAFSERFVLPFSHDEVVHLKKSMLDKMPGDLWQKFANLRALYAYQYAHPGKKMLFMGSEFGQWQEWSEERSLDWHLLDGYEKHGGVQRLVRRLNGLYREMPALYADDYSWNGFTWLDIHDARNSVISFLRHDPDSGQTIIVICNYTPVPRQNYPIGAPDAGTYRAILNTDAIEYGGSGVSTGPLLAEPGPWAGQPHVIRMTLPPLAVLYLILDEPEMPATPSAT
ncbi:MAG: 1,4-alpha-glucan branching protein GlgB [Anaerolineales bacterium]|nr:1,4-alpha-glucan branching protein GlgB [Anaerolineales bacterium]